MSEVYREENSGTGRQRDQVGRPHGVS